MSSDRFAFIEYNITNSPYNILWVTDRSINYHLARSAMNYLLYYTQYMLDVRRHVLDIVYLRLKTSSDKSGRKHYIDRARSIY